MILKCPLPEFRAEIVCDGKTVQVLNGYGQVIEKKEIDARTYVEIAEEVGKMEEALLKAASVMEA